MVKGLRRFQALRAFHRNGLFARAAGDESNGQPAPAVRAMAVCDAGSFEYDNEAPELDALGYQIDPWKTSYCQDEPMEVDLLGHVSRFRAIRLTGQWEMQHPWYEYLVAQDVLLAELDNLLDSLPLYVATMVHRVPIANMRSAGFFMTPNQPDFFSVMILNPGVSPVLAPGCLEAIKAMDERFLARGGKR